MTREEVLQKIREAKESNATDLYLNNSQLYELPIEISQLKNLRSLNLSRNHLSGLPKEIIELKNLQMLALDGNQLTKLPKEIESLVSLEGLYLDERQLKASAGTLIRLKNVALKVWNGNKYVSIPIERSSQVKNPQELLDYYFQTQQGEKRELNEAKILVVGQGSVGKTSLIKRLIDDKYNPKENKTDGIDIRKDWKSIINYRTVQLNVWDFGGQEIMHATHQFFLTKRSLYVLVLDTRLDKEENRIEYWLEKIKILGEDSPVIVVGNKIDQHPFDVNQSGLTRKYSNIKGFYPLSCQTQEGLNLVKAAILVEVASLSGIHDALPETWFNVKQALENMTEDYISFDKYIEICRDNEIIELDDQKNLIDMLHRLGIALNFSDDARMRDTNVLNPEWVTEGVYKILNARQLFRTKGELDREMLGQILDKTKYPEHKHLFIVDMMRKFELCFDIEENKKFLVPDLLDEDELNTGNWDNSLRFEYQYNILFSSIISRFMVKMHKSISKKTYWRTGVVMEYKVGNEVKNEALITADTGERKITIAIRRNENTRRDFISRIREKFEEIHGSFPKEFMENVAEKVPIPESPEYVVDYKHLLTLEQLGEENIIPEGMTKKFRVKDLLNGIVSEVERKSMASSLVEADSINKEVIVERKKEDIKELESKIEALEKIKSNCDEEAKPKTRIKALGLLLILIIVVGALVYYAMTSTNPNKNIYLTIFSIGLLIVTGVLSIINLKEWSPTKHPEQLFEKEKKRLYEKFGFDEKEFDALSKELEEAKRELKTLSKF